MIKRCLYCDREYKRIKRESKTNFENRKFCSRKCYNQHPNSKKGQFKRGHNTKMESNGCWKGGRLIDDKGYIRIAIGNKKWRYEHRIIVGDEVGRELLSEELVHHINGDKQDNRIENLQILTNSDHTKLHRGFMQGK